MAEQKNTESPLFEVGSVKVYPSRLYEVGRKMSAKGPSIEPSRLKSGVHYIRGGRHFTDATPTHNVTGQEAYNLFTLVKDRRFETDPIVREFDPNLTIRESAQ